MFLLCERMSLRCDFPLLRSRYRRYGKQNDSRQKRRQAVLADTQAGWRNRADCSKHERVQQILTRRKERKENDMSELSHLDELEAEAIYIIREVAAECEKPVMLYSIGKDSSVMLHLAMKAFYPEKPPFPFLHVNTTWKFKEMIEFRDRRANGSCTMKEVKEDDKTIAVQMIRRFGTVAAVNEAIVSLSQFLIYNRKVA